jgi:phosphoglycerate dehydrogenase-like enzyme
VGLLVDLYHVAVMGKDPARTLRLTTGRIEHVQIADVPGRHQPGTGRLGPRGLLGPHTRAGYAGSVGLEYQSLGPSATVSAGSPTGDGPVSSRQPGQRPIGVVYEPVQATTIVAELEARGVSANLVACTTESALRIALGEADFLVAVPFPPALIRAAPRVRWLQSLSAGVEGWLAPPGPPNWPITRMTGLYERYLAEYVLAHLLSRSQRLAILAAAQSRREWIPRSQWMAIRTSSLSGQVMGVAGLGCIGRQVAQLGQAFGMSVRGLQRRRAEGVAAPGQVRVFGSPDLAQFLTGLDVLVLTLPLTPQTMGLIGAAELARLNPSAIVINVARGPVIQEAALLGALRARRLSGAVLDTFAAEPLPTTSPLWDMPGVTITPHMAGEASAAEVAEVCAPNITRFLRGEVPGLLVDPERGY